MDFGVILEALHNFANVQIWLIMLLGVVVGLIVGILPGISGVIAITILLPFVFTLPPAMAFTLILSIWASQYEGGAITTILLNVPGEAGNAPTLFDGFPLTQQGQAGRALGAAQLSGLLAHVLTVAAGLFLIPLIIPFITFLRTGDMVFIVMLGITFIGALSEGSMIKGVISGFIGLSLTFVGYQPTTGISRFTFGSLFLYDGFPLVPVMMGMFAIPEMLILATRGGTIARTTATIRGFREVFTGAMEVFRHWSTVVRSQLIGFLVGLAPGAGAATASFIAYASTKRASKHPETFGKGNIEGVIGSESANQACAAGDLLTTLCLGIPGSSPMALLLGAIMILGLVPGPEMITKNLDLSLTMLWILAISAVIATVICFVMAPTLAKVAFLPGRVLVPLVTSVALVGAYAYREQVWDLVLTAIFGLFGLLMRKYGYNRAALVLGFVLGSLLEKYLFIALSIGGPFFWVQPTTLTFIGINIIALAWGPVSNLIRRRKAQHGTEAAA